MQIQNDRRRFIFRVAGGVGALFMAGCERLSRRVRAWRWPTVGKLVPSMHLPRPEPFMKSTNTAGQRWGGQAAVPMKTFGNFIAIATASSVHGHPRWDSTNRTRLK